MSVKYVSVLEESEQEMTLSACNESKQRWPTYATNSQSINASQESELACEDRFSHELTISVNQGKKGWSRCTLDGMYHCCLRGARSQKETQILSPGKALSKNPMATQCKNSFRVSAACPPRTQSFVGTTEGCRFSVKGPPRRVAQQRCGGFRERPEPQISAEGCREPINNMGMVFRNISVDTEPGVALYDITPQVKSVMEECKVGQGFVNVISRHTTTGITINEFEPRLLDDVRMFFRKLAPPGDAYLHNDLHLREAPENWPGGWQAWADQEPENAHSHLCSMVLGNSESIPVLNGELSIGQWQSIILVELDGPRKRNVGVQVVGGMDL